MNPEQFLSSLSGKKVAIVTHSGTDVDAIASAAALYFTFAKKAKISIAVADHINLNAKQFAQKMKLPYKINPPSLSRNDMLIVVDANSFGMLGALAEQVKRFPKNKPLLLLDHHSRSGDKIASGKLAVIHEKAISTTEIIFGLFKKNKIPINRKAAAGIAAGIVSDSANFLIADHSTFKIMAEVLNLSGMTYSELLSLFRFRPDISEKIARLKAAKRVRIYKSNEFIVASTDVGAHEASAATSLVILGADVAFAGDSERNEIKISGRANQNFIKRMKFDLTKNVFDYLEKQFGGEGGGHSGAAAYNSTGNLIEPLLKRCVELTHEHISKRKKSKFQLKEYK